MVDQSIANESKQEITIDGSDAIEVKTENVAFVATRVSGSKELLAPEYDNTSAALQSSNGIVRFTQTAVSNDTNIDTPGLYTYSEKNSEWVLLANSNGNGLDVSNDGSTIITNAEDINFGSNVSVTDDGNGTVTIDSNTTKTETNVVADKSERLALNAEKGDVAIQQDENQSYILKGTDPTLDSEWSILQSPTSDLTSIFGRTGDVTAQSGDYSHSQIGGQSTDDHHTRYSDSEAISAVNNSTLSNGLTLNDVLNMGSDNIYFQPSNDGGSVTGLTFESNTNVGSDYGYIEYHDDYFGDGSGESSALVLKSENDSGGGAGPDAIVLDGVGGTYIERGDLDVNDSSVTTDNFEMTENSSTNSLDFNYTG